MLCTLCMLPLGSSTWWISPWTATLTLASKIFRPWFPVRPTQRAAQGPHIGASPLSAVQSASASEHAISRGCLRGVPWPTDPKPLFRATQSLLRRACARRHALSGPPHTLCRSAMSPRVEPRPCMRRQHGPARAAALRLFIVHAAQHAAPCRAALHDSPRHRPQVLPCTTRRPGGLVPRLLLAPGGRCHGGRGICP